MTHLTKTYISTTDAIYISFHLANC